MTKEQKIIRFNLITSITLLSIFVIMLVGATIAYFSDTKQNTYTFTSGNVSIALSEAAVIQDASGNFVEDTSSMPIFGGRETTIHDYGKLYPAQYIYKNPTIINTGENAAWIAAKVTLTDGEGDLRNVMGYENSDLVDIRVLLSGGLLDEGVYFGTWNGIEDVCYNDHFAMIQTHHGDEGIYEFFFIMLDPVEVGAQNSVLLFDQLTVPYDWDHAEMKELGDLNIKVQAFGVQTQNLDSCFKAMTEAFPDHFNFN